MLSLSLIALLFFDGFLFSIRVFDFVKRLHEHVDEVIVSLLGVFLVQIYLLKLGIYMLRKH